MKKIMNNYIINQIYLKTITYDLQLLLWIHM